MKELDKGYEFTKAQIAELESLRAGNAKLKSGIAAEVIQKIAESEIWKELESLRAWKAEIEKQEPVAWVQISVEDGVDTKFPRLERPAKFNSEWWKFEPLYAAPVVSPDVEKLKAEIAELKSHNKRIMDMYVEYSDENRSLKAELEAALNDVSRFKGIADMWLWETVNDRTKYAAARKLTQVAFKESAAIEQAKGAV